VQPAQVIDVSCGVFFGLTLVGQSKAPKRAGPWIAGAIPHLAARTNLIEMVQVELDGVPPGACTVGAPV
jgi:hypothetical protein